MRVFYSPGHALHHSQAELLAGRIVPSFETPARAELVLDAVRAAGLGPIETPAAATVPELLTVHDALYLEFLAGAHAAWLAAGRTGEALPYSWRPWHAQRRAAPPGGLDGQLGWYSFDCSAGIGPGTFAAACASAGLALAAAAAVAAGATAAFALCRPPGHHAARDVYGGYCFLNNAALAVERLRASGLAKLAVLDVDYHHGNGTQAIFWERADVFVASLHGDPDFEFPLYAGFADERGAGAGLGANLNLPLPAGTDGTAYLVALDRALAALQQFGPDALVVSLGVDAFAGDPISSFCLQAADFRAVGARIAALARPVVFVLEGGYAVEAIGRNVVAVLAGFGAGGPGGT